MGKRKLHGEVYYQCDWTGHPMRHTNCYMPTWNDAGKLIKRGSYINWESVVAHAAELGKDDTITGEQERKIREHVSGIVGPLPDYVPHYQNLEHFKDLHTEEFQYNWSVKEYHDECCKYNSTISAVKITPTSDITEVLIQPSGGEYCFQDYLVRPYMHANTEQASTFVSMRKGKMPKDASVKVFYWPDKNGLEKNQLASNYFKMEMYGDVLVVKQCKETAAWPRERYTSLSVQQFEEVFIKKRKKPDDGVALSEDEFKVVKAQMQASVNGVEQQMSSCDASVHS